MLWLIVHNWLILTVPVGVGLGGGRASVCYNFVCYNIGLALAASVYQKKIYGISAIPKKYPVYQSYPNKIPADISILNKYIPLAFFL